MHIWGPIIIHPMTLPIADQIASFVVMSAKYTVTVYGAVLKPTIEDILFLMEHFN